jgi:GNAT superfamily N-acetyltransferase
MVASMQIRPSQENDARSISRVYIHTWQHTYLGLVPFGYLYAMSLSRLEQGFINELKSNKAISYVAEDYALYVLKNLQRQGIGSELVSALANRLNHFGIYSMLVWVLEHNPYRRLLDTVAYGWIDTKLIHH